MTIWRSSCLALAVAAAFPLPAAAQSNADLLKELRALRDRVTQLEDKLKTAEAAKPASAPVAAAAPAPGWAAAPVPAGMTPDQARELGRLAVKVDALEDQRESSSFKGLKISGSIDPVFIYNKAQDTAGFQLLNNVHDGLHPYTYDNSFIGTATIDFLKEFEGGTKLHLTLMPDRGVGANIGGSIVHEASASIPLTDEKTRLIVGQIPDWSGYEMLPPALNKLVTHNLLFDLIAPLSYTGAGLEVTRGAWIVKGVVGNMNATKKASGDKTPVLAYRGDYTIDEYSGIGFAGVHGKAYNPNGGADTGVNLFEVDGFYTRGDWTMQGQLSFGRQTDAAVATDADGKAQDAQWWGLSGLLAYKFDPRLEGVIRADYIYNRLHGGGLLGFGNDGINGIGLGYSRDGVLNDGQHGSDRYALSVGGNYRFNEYTLLKLEYRFDFADRRVFEYLDKNEWKKNNQLFGASVVVTF